MEKTGSTEGKARVCKACGAVMEEDYAFCPECGERRMRYCAHCGTEAEAVMRFCPECGKALETPKKATGYQKIKWQIPVCAVAALLILIGILAASGEKKSIFQRAYESAGGANFCGQWVSVYADGSGMRIDTNPRDIVDFYDPDALEAIRKIHASLGLPEVLLDKMTGTRALDGRQTAVYQGIEVSWSYHPDDGLEIIYEGK